MAQSTLAKITNFKLIPPLEKYPRVVAFAQTAPGKGLLLAVVALFLFLLGFSDWLLLAILLSAFSYWPQHRKTILPVATTIYVALGYAEFHWLLISKVIRQAGLPQSILSPLNAALALLSVLTFCAFAIYLTARSPVARYLKRPVLTLIVFYCALLCVASYLPLPVELKAFLWVFVIILGRIFWYLCYSLNECRAPRKPGSLDEIGHYYPFWFPQNIPFAKGSAYLNKIECKDPTSLAISQLKGAKLIIWAWLLHLFTVVFETLFFGQSQTLGEALHIRQYFGEIQILLNGVQYSNILHLPANLVVPEYYDALAKSAAGTPLPWYLNWATLVVHFFWEVLNFAVAGHAVIAIVRMCGFNALRNTFSPLSSANIAEFWNRFFYYYKELLVEFFYYPTFFRYFKTRPILRMYLATLAAAGFGNSLYHFLRDINYIIDMGFFSALVATQTFAFYGFILGTAIFLSQWRQERLRRRRPHVFSRLTAPIVVIGFYCLASVFMDYRRHSITENFDFFLALFNLSF